MSYTSRAAHEFNENRKNLFKKSEIKNKGKENVQPFESQSQNIKGGKRKTNQN